MLSFRMISIVLALSSGLHTEAAEIKWNVVHPFPLIEVGEFEKLRAVWRELPNKTMHAFVIRRMEQKAEKGDKSAYLLANPKTAASQVDRQLHDVGPVRVRMSVPGASGCTWKVNPTPFSEPAQGSCLTEMSVVRDTPYTVHLRDSAGLELGVDVKVRDVLVVAMGDSYSSGEGAPDLPAVYGSEVKQSYLRANDWHTRGPGPRPAEWFDQACHRSLLSWQPLAALRLAMERKDVVVRLLYTSCSGAEFFDGLLVAQAKRVETEALRSKLVETVDGEGKRKPQQYPPPYLSRSQVNTVRDHLCEWETDLEDVEVDRKFRFRATSRVCTKLKPGMAPDVLLLTAGGNDVNFSGAVGGTLLADKARSLLGQPFIDAMRNSLNLIKPERLKANIDGLTPSYARLVAAVATGAKTPLNKTVLMHYPNPIGADGERGIGNACYEKAVRERVRTAFTAFSVTVRDRSPFRGTWVAELHPSEVNQFANNALPALERMQASAGVAHVGWLDSAPKAYERRLLCTDEVDDQKRVDQLALEPQYFCQIGEGGRLVDKCTALDLASWNSELPGRRLVNTTNDAVLIQRTWAASKDEEQFLVGAAGTFHPNAEAHSVAADSAFAAMCKILEARRICN